MENSRSLEAGLAAEGRLDRVEAVLARSRTLEREFVERMGDREMLQLTGRFKVHDVAVPSPTARLRRRQEREDLEEELARLEAELATKAKNKADHLSLVVSPPSQPSTGRPRKIGGGAYARRATTATNHVRAMSETRSEVLFVDRNGGYTTFGEQGNWTADGTFIQPERTGRK